MKGSEIYVASRRGRKLKAGSLRRLRYEAFDEIIQNNFQKLLLFLNRKWFLRSDFFLSSLCVFETRLRVGDNAEVARD